MTDGVRGPAGRPAAEGPAGGGGPSAAGVGDARAKLRDVVRPGAGTWPAVGDPGVRDAAVLVLFGPLDAVPARTAAPAVPADLDVLLLARSATLSSHAGQVAFPGGRRDDGDADPTSTALREAVEETGLDPAGVQVLGTMAPLPVPVSRHRVTPVVAWWAAPSAVDAVDPAESAQVFRAPVADLVDPANRRTAVVHRDDREWPTPAFVLPAYPDHLVWGFTGVVLSALFDETGWAVPWDRDRRVDPLAGRGLRTG